MKPAASSSLVLSTINFQGTFLLSRSTTCCQMKVPKAHSISSHRTASSTPSASSLTLGWGFISQLTYFQPFLQPARSQARAGLVLASGFSLKGSSDEQSMVTAHRSHLPLLIPPTPWGERRWEEQDWFSSSSAYFKRAAEAQKTSEHFLVFIFK